MPGYKIMPQLVAWLLASAWLMSISMNAFEPRVLPDELCYMGWARLFAGEGGFYSMGFAAYCPPGYGLLLAPLHWAGGEPSSLYRSIMMLNALIGGACLPIARNLAATHFDMDRALAWLVGIAAVLYPSLIAYSGYALPETLLYTLALCWVAAWCRWVERKTIPWLMLLALLSIAMYGVHSRMLVVPAFFALAVCVAAAAPSRSMRSRYLLAAVGTLLAIYGLGLVKKYTLSLGWSADPLLSLDLLARLGRWNELLTSAARVSGQLLSVGAMSVGLALIPCAWLLGRTFIARPFADRNTALKAIAAPAILVMLATEAAIFFTASDRFDLHFYARYIGPWAMTCCVIAPGLIKRAELRPISLGLGLLMTVIVLLLLVRPPSLPVTDYARIHVAGVQPVIDWFAASPDHGMLALRVVTTAAAILVTAVALMLLGRRVFVAAAIVTGMLLSRPAPDLQQEPLVSALPVEITAQLQKPRCRIVWSDTINESLQMRHRYRLQYLYPHCEFLTPTNSDCELPREGVLVARADSRCAWTDAETIPLPPGLLLVRGEAAGSP